MDVYSMSETAYKNGYNKAAEDFADRARTAAFDNIDDAASLVQIYKAIDRIAEDLLRKE